MRTYRLIILISVFLLAFGALEAKLFNLQVQKSGYYLSKVEALSALREELALRRGEIFFTDRNGNKIPASINKDYPIIYAVPRDIEDPGATAAELAPLIGWEEKKLQEVLDNPDSLFRMLVERVDAEELAMIQKGGVQGVYADTKQYRFYPFETLGSHLLGFVGVNKEVRIPKGLYGAEKRYNKELELGGHVELTIDRNIQAQAEQILGDLAERFSAKGGSVIVQEPKSGKILAMAGVPAFNPNVYGESPVENFLNPAIQEVYEAGSVMKPITMAIGIDTAAITPETTYYDTGKVVINGETIKNWDLKAHGIVTMTNVLEESINTGAVFAVRQIKKNDFVTYVKKFGFGEKTGINLPDEVQGSIWNIERRDAQDIDFAAVSFGQGAAVTPIQIVGAFSALANGGTLMRPLIRADEAPKVLRRVVEEGTALKVTRMLESAVEKARLAALPGHRIAGKTGTAQIADLVRGGYTEEFNHTYIGYGPLEDPRFTIFIRLEEPQALLAGATVVPAFREMASFMVSYYNIPPDK